MSLIYIYCKLLGGKIDIMKFPGIYLSKTMHANQEVERWPFYTFPAVLKCSMSMSSAQRSQYKCENDKVGPKNDLETHIFKVIMGDIYFLTYFPYDFQQAVN